MEDRKKMWELLQRTKDKSQDPWLALGDFNEALWQFEHFSATKRGGKNGRFSGCSRYM
jgi:endonuclease/exonuclease/phosphatase family metal-dependent hydrolase